MGITGSKWMGSNFKPCKLAAHVTIHSYTVPDIICIAGHNTDWNAVLDSDSVY